MKLTHYRYFKPIDITLGEPCTLVIEDPAYFRNIIIELLSQSETGIGDFILSDDKDKNYNLAKNSLIITDLFNFVALEKQIKIKLTGLIAKEYETKKVAGDLLAMVNLLGIDIMNNCQYPVKFKETITFQEIIKLMDFNINFNELNYIERFIEFVKICTDLFDYKLLVVVNIKEVMSEEEYMLFIQDIQNRGIPLLMIERFSSKELCKKCKEVIIDKDLCVI